MSKDTACEFGSCPCRWAGPSRLHSLFSHAGVFQDVHIDEESLLVFAHSTQKQSPLLQQASGGRKTRSGFTHLKYVSSCSKSASTTGNICTRYGGLTIKGKVTDEPGWFIAGGSFQEKEQLGPELAQISVLLPRSNSWNSYSSRGFD